MAAPGTQSLKVRILTPQKLDDLKANLSISVWSPATVQLERYLKLSLHEFYIYQDLEFDCVIIIRHVYSFHTQPMPFLANIFLRCKSELNRVEPN